MAYLHHIKNLYQSQEILLFKRCYALEKAHGTSIKTTYSFINGLRFFSGGAKHEEFIKLFNQELLLNKFKETFLDDVEITFYGECIGGKIQGMSHTYGKNMFAIFFEVVVNGKYLNVPNAEKIITDFGLEFIPYKEISTNIEDIDNERDRDSEIAVRRGCGIGHIKEGVVLRSLIEVTLNNGERIIAKHKREEFREIKTPRPVVDPNKLKILEDAKLISDEYVTKTRLIHVLDKIPNANIEQTGEVIKLMLEDIKREAQNEIICTKDVEKTIGKDTALMFKNFLKERLTNL